MDTPKNISLFIPHLLPNITQNDVAHALAKLGEVDQVDFISKFDKNGQLCHSAFVYFNGWHHDSYGFNIQENIRLFGHHKFYNEKTWKYWTLLPNTSTRFPQRKPILNLTDSFTTPTKKTSVTCPYAPHKYSHTTHYPQKLNIAPAMSPIPYPPYIPSIDYNAIDYNDNDCDDDDFYDQLLLEDDCQREIDIEWMKSHY